MHDNTIADTHHPNITDGNDRVWTWRGKGYAIDSVKSDVDPLGNPWLTTEATILELAPHRPKVANAGKKGGTLTPKTAR